MITGPGVTNVATPVADAYTDAVPLLVIASGLPRASRGRRRGELHEVKNQLGVMEALAGWTRAVSSVEEIPDAIRDAFRAMRMGRPRGAYLEIPLDVLAMRAEVTIPAPAPITFPEPSEKISVFASYLREAQRPLIIAGNGVTAAGANAQLLQLAELLGAPVFLDRKGRDVLPTGHPLVIPTSGYPFTPSMQEIIGASDVALVVESSSGMPIFGQNRVRLPDTVLQIDREPSDIGRLFPVTQGMVGGARFAVDGLLAALQDAPRERPSRAEDVAHVKRGLMEYVWQKYGSNVAFLDAVRKAVPRDGVIVADMTKLGYAGAEYLPFYEPCTFIHPSELCSIGCGLPLALGAKVAAPRKPVVALCGDGGFLLNAGELATAAQERLDVVTVLFNDATYTAVKQQQARRFHRRYIATDLQAPDYVMLARAFGIESTRVATPGELEEALAQAIQRGGASLIEVTLPPVEW